MIQNVQSPPKLDLLEGLAECFSLDVAQRVADYRIDDKSQARLDHLGEKCNEGLLSPEERSEYEYYVRVLQFVSILQAKARYRLKTAKHEPQA